ncbi:MAG: hypothetical protein JKX75_09990 [Gammaproteobacteria bacterium]|nr:hypothetical protein [Gammaproteobacteria bacterium]
MLISSGFNSALSGVRNGFERLQDNASQIANATTGDFNSQRSLLESVVDLKASVVQIQASMQVVKALDNALGTLLDVKA